MDRHSVDWKGYITAVTTPFTQDGELDLAGFSALLEWLISEGMHGLMIAGTTGEWPSLAAAERVAMFETASKQVRGRVPVLAGGSAFTPAEVVEYAQAAADHGLDGIMVSPPPYVLPTHEETLAFFDAVNAGSPLPICLYNRPQCTGIELSPILDQLATLDKVVAVKNSTSDLAAFIDRFFALKDQIRFFGFPPNEFGMSLVRDHGGDGSIAACGVLGASSPGLFNHLWAGELEEARACAAREREYFNAFSNRDFSSKLRSSPQAVHKAALNVRGLPGGYPRPPLLPLSDDETDMMRSVLERIVVDLRV